MTTFSNMLGWLERPFQTTVARERSYLVDQANKIRQFLYDLYAEYELAIDVTECFEVQQFNASDACLDVYGVTLPPYMETVEGAFLQGRSFTLYTKWREFKTGFKNSSDCGLSIYDIPGSYCTERDILLPKDEEDNQLCSICLELFARANEDAGKKVEIRYVAEDDMMHSEYVELSAGAGKRTQRHAKKIDAIILPTDLKGAVKLSQSDGRVLSEYSPYEHVPSYRRIKTVGVGCDSVVAITASRKYFPLSEDNDIVEFDDRLIVEHIARHLFYAESGADRRTLAKAEYHRAAAVAMLQSKSGRKTGVGVNDSFRGPPVKRTRLNANAGGHIVA